MSVVKRKTVTSKKDVQERRRGRRQRYLRGSSIGHFDSNEDAADVVGLLHEREDDRMSTSNFSFDITCLD